MKLKSWSSKDRFFVDVPCNVLFVAHNRWWKNVTRLKHDQITNKIIYHHGPFKSYVTLVFLDVWHLAARHNTNNVERLHLRSRNAFGLKICHQNTWNKAAS